ncbi:MAG: hypothetical protein RL846_36610, partial [Deltaproteobacteria bacterium]
MAAVLVSSSALAKDLTVLVAPKGSAAYDAAKSMADGTSVLAERKLHKAFGRAVEHLGACGACVVQIKVAAGTYEGKGRTGQWSFPEVKNPQAKLRILGGYDDKFSHRAPFSQP